MQTVIETKGLCKVYGRQFAVDHLDLTVPEGCVYGFIGPNGAGKSTTMKMLLGLIHPSAGQVTLLGRTLTPRNRLTLLRQTGSLIESPAGYGHLTGQENLEIVADLKGVPRKDIDRVLEIVHLTGDRKRKVGQYSLGMRQRLGIAQALLGSPKLLILDEPTNGLDPIGIAEIRAFLRSLCQERGKTILISSHILSEISLLADDVGIIDHGVLLEEESLAELEAKNGRYIHLTVSDAAQAARLLETQLHTAAFRVEDARSLRILDPELPLPDIARTMLADGLALYDLHLCEDTLEDYFKRVIGGEGIA